jgi:hypothetical protein
MNMDKAYGQDEVGHQSKIKTRVDASNGTPSTVNHLNVSDSFIHSCIKHIKHGHYRSLQDMLHYLHDDTTRVLLFVSLSEVINEIAYLLGGLVEHL